MNLSYPDFFDEVLRDDKHMRSAIDGTVSDFQTWFEFGKLDFFPEYTDHGMKHVNQVLATCANLIADEARPLFTPADAATLIASVILHDSAMHINESCFRRIITGDCSDRVIPEFRDKPWPALWADYVFSVRRWDDKQIFSHLGEENLTGEIASTKDLFPNFQKLTTIDRKIIGEFIRRHHPRLAHEFALFRLPGPRNAGTIGLAEAFGHELSDITGLVARSHGLPVRDCVDYLQKKYHRREYKQVHAVFLMVLLRISDLIQIQPERAPIRIFQYMDISSPLSRLEWCAHQAVENITQTHDDPESIEVQVKPPNAVTCLRLKGWLSEIQNELDSSWAVLGEIYGSHKKLSKLGLIIRRVRSNLDNVERFAESVDFFPHRTELDVARPDLLKLMIRPLYGNIPQIGIRELLQNSIDAVRERWALGGYPSHKHSPRRRAKSHIEVWLSVPDAEGCSWLTIRDCGVGMTPEVIRDYFLKAGASFRNSDTWKKGFEFDHKQGVRVLRSGRFGIGVLAAFLIGPVMEVSTRHVNSPRGVQFSLDLDSDVIELKYANDLPVGTTIRIRVPPANYKEILQSTQPRTRVPDDFSWYCYSWPVIARYVDSAGRQTDGRHRRRPGRTLTGNIPQTHDATHSPRKPRSTRLEQTYNIDPARFNRPSEWRKLRNFSAYDVYWSYSAAPHLSVNGIFVSNSATFRVFSKHALDNIGFDIRVPRLCIHDPGGVFPLNLQRTNITESHCPFDYFLAEDIIDDWLAYLITICPDVTSRRSWRTLRNLRSISTKPEIDGFHGNYKVNPIVATSEGIAPIWVFPNITRPATLCFLMNDGGIASRDDINFKHDAALHIERTHRSYHRLGEDAFKALMKEFDEELAGILDLFDYFGFNVVSRGDYRREKDTTFDLLTGGCQVLGARAIVPFKQTSNLKKGTGLSCGGERNGLAFLSAGNCPDSLFEIDRLDNLERGQLFAFEVFLDGRTRQKMRPSRIEHHWQEIVRYPCIPFEPDARHRRLRNAYDTLLQFIESHRAMAEQGVLR